MWSIWLCLPLTLCLRIIVKFLVSESNLVLFGVTILPRPLLSITVFVPLFSVKNFAFKSHMRITACRRFSLIFNITGECGDCKCTIRCLVRKTVFYFWYAKGASVFGARLPFLSTVMFRLMVSGFHLRVFVLIRNIRFTQSFSVGTLDTLKPGFNGTNIECTKPSPDTTADCNK